MEESLRQLSQYLNIEALNTDKSLMIAVIISLVFGIVYCFFGYKAIRVCAAIYGALIGIIAGSAIVRQFALQSPVSLIVVIGLAVLLALLGFFLFRVGVFIVVLLGVAGIVYPLLQSRTTLEQLIMSIIALAAGLVAAILAVIYMKPVVIVLSAFMGAQTISSTIFTYLVHIRWSRSLELLVVLAVFVLFAVIGMVYQFASTRHMD